jgi:hypothetical protein
MSYRPATPILVIAAFAALVYFTAARRRAPDKGTQVPLEVTSHTWSGTRTHDDKPESSLEVVAPSGDKFTLSLYDGGLLYQERAQADANQGKEGWAYKWIVHRYAVDYDTDAGAWAGFRVKGSGETSGLDVGLRYSPVRFLYGVVAPDILVSPEQAGVGVSVYPFSQSVPSFFQHTGAGLGYLADYDGGSGWVPYLSLSTRF